MPSSPCANTTSTERCTTCRYFIGIRIVERNGSENTTLNNGKNRPQANNNDTSPAPAQNQTRRRSDAVKGEPGADDIDRANAHNATTSTTIPAYSPEPEKRRAGSPSGPTAPQYAPPSGVSVR